MDKSPQKALGMRKEGIFSKGRGNIETFGSPRAMKLVKGLENKAYESS